MASRSSLTASTVGEVLAQSPSLNPEGRLSWHAWRDFVGTRIAQRSRPGAIERQTLTVIVASPTWAQELSLLQEPILQRLRAKFPDIRALRFQIGRLELPGHQGVRARVRPAQIPENLNQQLASLDDPELQRILAEAISLNLGVRRGRRSR